MGFVLSGNFVFSHQLLTHFGLWWKNCLETLGNVKKVEVQ